LDAGALLDDCCHFLETGGVMTLLADVAGTAIHREMVPGVQDGVLYGLKTLCARVARPHARGSGLQGRCARIPWRRISSR
jgi:hypothetical protein